MATLPNVSVTVRSGGRPVRNSGLLRTQVMIGTAAEGPIGAPRFVTFADLLDTYKSGDAVKHAARTADKTAAALLFVRVKTTPKTATTTVSSQMTGTAIPSATGTPTEAWDIKLTATGAGTVVSGSATYELTKDGGDTVTTGTVPSTGIVPVSGSGVSIVFNPPEDALVPIATEIREDLLAHFANATAHNSADAAAAALITLAAPGTNAESYAVLNQCRAALLLHLDNDTVHDSQDLANVITTPVATDEQSGRLLGIALKAKINLHLAATYPADDDSLHASTASSASPVTYTDATLIAGGITQLNGYPSYITITTGGLTPSDAPASATITGTNADTGLSDSEVVTVSQVAGTATAAKRFLGTGTSIAFLAGDGTGATIKIGTTAAAHNSADVTNTITASDPSSGTIAEGDVVQVVTTDPSPAILSLKKSGGGTLSPTASGTPVETVRGRVEFLTAGAIGTDGITLRVSLDDGATWQTAVALGTAESLDLFDVREDESTYPIGVTLNFTNAQTVDATTVITFRTTAPQAALVDVLAAIDAVMGSAFRQTGWRFFHIAGAWTAADMAQVQTKMNALQNTRVWNYASMNFRDRRPYEPEADWIAHVVAQRLALVADRVVPCAGFARYTCPVTGRKDRAPASVFDVTRRLCVSPRLESGETDLGALGTELNGNTNGFDAGDVEIYEDGVRVEYDAEIIPTLVNARVTVLRTFSGEGSGVYVAGSFLGSGSSSKFQRSAQREVNDVISRAANSQGIKTLLKSVTRNPGTYPTDRPAVPGDPGTITENEAESIEVEMRTAILNEARGLVSNVTVVLSRTDDLTASPATITFQIIVEGVTYVEIVNITQLFNG